MHTQDCVPLVRSMIIHVDLFTLLKELNPSFILQLYTNEKYYMYLTRLLNKYGQICP